MQPKWCNQPYLGSFLQYSPYAKYGIAGIGTQAEAIYNILTAHKTDAKRGRRWHTPKIQRLSFFVFESRVICRFS
jgi:hypothetical protein